MNSFEALCDLASREKWCWSLACLTCRHMHFRYAFSELAAGKSPEDSDWIIHARRNRYSKHLGHLPVKYTSDQKETVINICLNADLSSIASECTFPDWLGYLGLVLQHMRIDSYSYRKLSENWASQLSELVPQYSPVHSRLLELAKGNGILNLKDLEYCESEINDNVLYT